MRLLLFNILFIFIILNSVCINDSHSTVGLSDVEIQKNNNGDTFFFEGIPYPLLLSPSNSTTFPFNLKKGVPYAVLLGGEYISNLHDLDLRIFDENLTQIESVDSSKGKMTQIPSFVPEYNGTYYFVIDFNPNGDGIAICSLLIATLLENTSKSFYLGANGNSSSYFCYAINVKSHPKEKMKISLSVEQNLAAEIRLYPFTLVNDQKKFIPTDSNRGGSFQYSKATKKGETLSCSIELDQRNNDPVFDEWILVTTHLLYGEGEATLNISYEEIPEDWERWAIHGVVFILSLVIFLVFAIFGEKYIR